MKFIRSTIVCATAESLANTKNISKLKKLANMKTLENKKWYWVLGNTKKGFKIVDKKPRTKYVPEPFDNLENAKRWMALEYLLNA
jgi:hypothetical protein